MVSDVRQLDLISYLRIDACSFRYGITEQFEEHSEETF